MPASSSPISGGADKPVRAFFLTCAPAHTAAYEFLVVVLARLPAGDLSGLFPFRLAAASYSFFTATFRRREVKQLSNAPWLISQQQQYELAIVPVRKKSAIFCLYT